MTVKGQPGEIQGNEEQQPPFFPGPLPAIVPAIVKGKIAPPKDLAIERLKKIANEKLGIGPGSESDAVEPAPHKRDICWWTHCHHSTPP